ncbi:virulence protein [Clostridium magnum]|uniref:Virulence protein n=1 Tax=Clostridium magnum DSM 2767 TaxID=1121326 RepID=A0A162TMY5_9CLOT|nr:virulence protein [Clostridium magnum]KZL92845.1 hypothetical protein CLMAG_26590 [Clostridium magnum DSM 2767]SHI28373.1 hypothetical protein SAMN02745944_03985 [Clostridium magnum DSM 2767]
MQIIYNVTGPKRKSLVSAISQELNATIKYLGAPTFAYEVAGYHIDKNGMLDGEDNYGLVADLQGLHDFKAVTEKYDTPLLEAEPIPDGFHDYEEPTAYDETEIYETAESSRLIIQMPRSAFTNTALENLKGLVESKASLIKKALGTDSIPIIENEEIVTFPWFQGECSSDEVKAYTHFITALCEIAKKQTRVNSTEKPVDNEKYAFRCFLLRLGFIGSEHKTERKILLSKLTGSSAFKSGTAKHEEVNEQ